MNIKINIAVPFFNFVLLLTVPLSTAFSATTDVAIQQIASTESTLNKTLDKDTSRIFDVRLYAHNENLVLRYSSGKNVIFKPYFSQFPHRLLKDKVHFNDHMGIIETNNAKRSWRPNNNITIEFLGSYPITASTQAHRINLMYENAALRSISFSDEHALLAPQLLERVIERINSQLAQVEQITCPDDSHAQCTDTNAPLPTGFNYPSDPNELHINIRPSDCHSFFTAFPSIERGTAIEEALSDHAPYLGSESGAHSFPVADYWNNGNVYVLISRDLTAATYLPELNPDGFYEQLIADGENIQENLIQVLATEGQISNTANGQSTTCLLYTSPSPRD